MAHHFLSLTDLTPPQLEALIQRAIELKKAHREGTILDTMKRKVLAMVFEKSSTRTRVSFEIGMTHLGGSALFLSPRDTQLGRGEPIEDTARVLSRMADLICVRTHAHEKITRFAANSTVPVINALTDSFHPCQLLADIMTFVEQRGCIKGASVTWLGDGNNMCHSYINAAKQFDFQLRICTPKQYSPNRDIMATAEDHVDWYEDPLQAVKGSQLIATDVWASMGQEDESSQRIKAFQHLQVNDQLMQAADKDALFMHCLPAHRGEEVTSDVIDGPQSVVWDQAENRLHAQKALLEMISHL